MTRVTLSLRDIRRWFKIRYPLLMLILIIISIVIPYYLPYYKDFNPVYSINSDGNYGHSMLSKELSLNYDVQEIWRDINDIDFESHDALVIITPQLQFTQEEINKISDLVFRQEVPVLIFGNTQEVLELSSNFEMYPTIDSSGSRIFDYHLNLNDDPAYPVIFGNNPNRLNDNTQQFISVTPTPLEYNFQNRFEFRTNQSAEIGGCISTIGEGCEQSFVIGGIHQYLDISLISDNWLLSNFVLEKASKNNDLIPYILDHMDRNDVKRIYFEESHYKWAPLNERGVTIFVEKQLNIQLIALLSVIFTILLPLFLYYSSGGIKSKENTAESLTQNIRERLNYIHLERLPAAPLSLEERTLVGEKLEHEYRGRFYFQYVANELYETIKSYSFEPDFDPELLQYLNDMRYHLLTDSSAWSIIKSINIRLDKLLKERPRTSRSENIE